MKPATTIRSLLILVLLSLSLQGCAWIRSWGDDDDPNAPAPLVDINESLRVKKAWSINIGSGINRQYQNLTPFYATGSVYAADYKGRLMALESETGRKRWELKTELPFSGGPGVNDQTLVMGTENGEVVAYEVGTGQERWKATVSSEVLSTPAVADNVVVVRCIDGRVFGLDIRTGERLWIYDRSVPLLTLRGNASPLARAGVVYIGYDGGEVVALRASDGNVLWVQNVVSLEGRTELDRLSDVDGNMAIVASDLFVASYKSRLASLAANSGSLLWFKDIGSATGVTVERTTLAISDKESTLWALDRRNGSTLWKQEDLLNRGLTRPAIYGDYILVGDDQGYLHWMNLSDGQFVARTKVGGDGFAAAPLAVGTTVYVYTKDGNLIAYRAGAAI